MRTTLDLPDGVLRRVKARAALKGSTIKALVTLDANVWLALAAEAHTHHQQAKAYWEVQVAPYLAAFVFSGGMRLVSFDKGFSTFQGLDRLTL